MVYTIIGHFLATGERLFKYSYVRCLDVVPGGCRFVVGGFDSDDLCVGGIQDDLFDPDLGVASARKPS